MPSRRRRSGRSLFPRGTTKKAPFQYPSCRRMRLPAVRFTFRMIWHRASGALFLRAMRLFCRPCRRKGYDRHGPDGRFLRGRHAVCTIFDCPSSYACHLLCSPDGVFCSAANIIARKAYGGILISLNSWDVRAVAQGRMFVCSARKMHRRAEKQRSRRAARSIRRFSHLRRKYFRPKIFCALRRNEFHGKRTC